MYRTQVHTSATREKVFEAFQSTLLPNGFEIVDKTGSKMSFRHGLWIGKHSSPLTSFSRVSVSLSSGRVEVEASYGNATFYCILAAAVLSAFFAFTFVLTSGLTHGRSWVIYIALIGFLFLPVGFLRAKMELDKLVRSLRYL